jgi:L-asparaginase
LIREVTGLDEVAHIVAAQHAQVPSPSLTFPMLFELLGKARQAVADGAVGVVVTQGTDTIEETSYFLDLLWDLDAPIVITGAMRNPSLPGNDGPSNLFSAVRVAAATSSRGRGALVVFNDQIHAARYVRKAHTFALETFESPALGPIGWIVEGEVVFLASLERHPALRPAAGELPAVATVQACLGDAGRMLPAILPLGFQGLVVEATGGGHVPKTWMTAMKDLLEAIPVVIASRTGAGQVLRSTYDFEGSEVDLQVAGAVTSFNLNGPKARVLLSLLLAAGVPRSDLGVKFAEYGR